MDRGPRGSRDSVELRNVVTVVPGRSEETIVVVAHRDNAGPSRATRRQRVRNRGPHRARTRVRSAGARAGPDARSTRSCSSPPTPARTAARVLRASRRRRRSLAAAIAVVVLDGLGGRGRPRLAIAGDEPVSPARPLVRTAAARVEEEVGVSPALPSRPDPARRSRHSVRARTSRGGCSGMASPP